MLNEGWVAEGDDGDEGPKEMVAKDPCELVNADITKEEVVLALGRLKRKAAPGRGWSKCGNGVLRCPCGLLVLFVQLVLEKWNGTL